MKEINFPDEYVIHNFKRKKHVVIPYYVYIYIYFIFKDLKNMLIKFRYL